jgi:hypothetical protein
MAAARRRTRRKRRPPGTGGHGTHYRVEVRTSRNYTAYRIQDVGNDGHTKRLAARTPSGRWVTKTWLIDKRDAHVENGRLVIDRPKTKSVLRQIVGPIRHVKGDVFRARPKNVPERAKPTPAQLRAIRKALAARRLKRSRAARSPRRRVSRRRRGTSRR